MCIVRRFQPLPSPVRDAGYARSSIGDGREEKSQKGFFTCLCTNACSSRARTSPPSRWRP
ncbi:hypothetical protein MTBSS4_100035 [Magnetospirillum sp. SS-4]|nr:hypothetical protein MTBSS4_100035 [Magnetospirillum sp. SS-4]